MQRLVLLGLNHTTAPLDVRERLAFTPEQQRHAIERMRRTFPAAEFVLVSTCNRVELYVAREVHGQPRTEQLVQFLSEFHGVPPDLFRPHLYEFAERDAIGHLFSVTASLDSMVLGESQIVGQVRTAYDLSRELGAAGATLNPLFQRAIAAGKEVLHATPLGQGRVSISGVAVDYARRIFDRFSDKTVLCIGAGKMAVLALRGFAALKPRQLLVCNRDEQKAARIAEEFGGIPSALTTLEHQLVQADIVITSTGATQPIITRKMFDSLLRQRRYRPIFIIDIAVPRDVEASVAELDHVYLYNLDDLQRALAESHAQRSEASVLASRLVQAKVDEYLAWRQQRELGPVIDGLYKRLHAMAADEVSRTLHKLPHAGEQERAHLEELARRIVNKLLHDPVQALRDSDNQHPAGGQYLHAIQRMFRLNLEDDEQTQPDATSDQKPLGPDEAGRG